MNNSAHREMNINRKNIKDMKLNDRVIAVIGLGYVGLPLAIEYGKKSAA